jgi:asparagine synthase (glutamine-hydrolysing)
MCSDSGKLWITYNGEVYNYLELRDELMKLGHRFCSNSDTEVILKAYEQWGAECVSRFNGMWAFAMWDLSNHLLFCSRDRFGVKPFYYYWDGETFAFASELKALLELGFPLALDDRLVTEYLTVGLLDHSERTMLKEFRRLPAAHNLVLSFAGSLVTRRYWDLTANNELGSDEPSAESAERFLEIFTDAVRLRLRSDVTVGSCLSGGLDSSSIVCSAARLLSGQERRVDASMQTFTASFPEPRYDERSYVRAVVRDTGVEPTYVFPDSQGFADDLESMVWYQDEPFDGTGVYSQWCVMRAARERGVPVLLDGQGGDELLAGYRKFNFFLVAELARTHRCWECIRELFGFLANADVLRTLNVQSGLRYLALGRKIMAGQDLLRTELSGRATQREMGCPDGVGERLKADLFKFSLPVLLRFEDRNSMAHSVETRLPFLDYRLAEYAAALPLRQKLHHGWTKVVLRDAMRNVLPEEVRTRRSKLGFSTPTSQWITGSLRERMAQTFASATYLPRYIRIEKLAREFTRPRRTWTAATSEFYMKSFLFELFARKFRHGSAWNA